MQYYHFLRGCRVVNNGWLTDAYIHEEFLGIIDTDVAFINDISQSVFQPYFLGAVVYNHQIARYSRVLMSEAHTKKNRHSTERHPQGHPTVNRDDFFVNSISRMRAVHLNLGFS